MQISIIHRLFRPLAIATTVLLTACGGGSSGGGGPLVNVTTLPVSNPDSRLIGQFTDALCQKSIDSSLTNDLRFNPDGTFHFVVTTYLFANCSEPLFTMDYSGNYFEGDPSVLADGQEIVELDLQQTTNRLLTPLNDFAADAINDERLCDRDNWQSMVPQPIAGCVIAGVIESVILPTIFQVYNLQENHYLYMSQETSFSAENRASNLPVFPVFVRELAPSDDFPADIMGVWRSPNANIFVEFRPNGMFQSYIPDQINNCIIVARKGYLNQGSGLFSSFDGELFELTPTIGGILLGVPGTVDSALFVRDSEQSVQQLDFC